MNLKIVPAIIKHIHIRVRVYNPGKLISKNQDFYQTLVKKNLGDNYIDDSCRTLLQ